MATLRIRRYIDRLAPIVIILKAQKKELLMLIIGAMISLVSSLLTTYLNNIHTEDQDRQSKKSEFTNNYIQQLNKRYILFIQYFDQVRTEDSVETKSYLQNLVDSRRNWLVNSRYDSVQLNRYFDGRYNSRIKYINDLLDENSQYVQSYSPEIEYKLQMQVGIIGKLIDEFEEDIFHDIDKD